MGENLNHSPHYGRSPSHERAYDERPVAKGKRISMVSALTTSGMKAALNYEGTITGIVFLHFLQHYFIAYRIMGSHINKKQFNLVTRLDPT